MSKTKTLTVEAGEDKGKVFIIRRMPAVKGDRFMMRLLHGLAEKGLDIAASQEAMGMLGINQLTINLIGTLSADLFLDLTDEILEYVEIVPGGGKARNLEKDIDIQDMLTFSKIRMAFVEVHSSFLAQGENQS